jgi:hypothetical protein
VVPRQVRSEVRLLKTWRDALSVVRRITRSDSDPNLSTIRLAVGSGNVRLFARDSSRAHWATIPAHTTGAALVAMDRSDVLMRHWAQPGRLSIFSDWLKFEPDDGGIHWAPVLPATMPSLPDEPGCAGAVLHRDDLRAALGEVLGGRLGVGDLPEAIRLAGDGGDRLVLQVEGGGVVRVPTAYMHGGFEVSIAPRWLLDAVAAAPAEEVTLETAGRWQPLVARSGWFEAMIAARTEESVL